MVASERVRTELSGLSTYQLGELGGLDQEPLWELRVLVWDIRITPPLAQGCYENQISFQHSS